MGFFDEMDRARGKVLTTYSVSAKKAVRAPFTWPGAKSKSVPNILDVLPTSATYVEPFGGSFAVGLAKPAAKLDVFNDLSAGLVCFYRCMRDPDMMDQLTAMIQCTIHSQEEWDFCHKTWTDPNISDVDRAFRWYYMTAYSFGGLGRAFGKMQKPMNGTFAGKIRNNLRLFPELHARMKQVQVMQTHWKDCVSYFDSEDTVFYMDPPYYDTTPGVYKNELTKQEHREMLDIIQELKGYVALSGYDNELYNSYNWSDKYEWNVRVTIEGPTGRRAHAKECLWIKDFS